jgi:hypothetical protein
MWNRSKAFPREYPALYSPSPPAGEGGGEGEIQQSESKNPKLKWGARSSDGLSVELLKKWGNFPLLKILMSKELNNLY